MAFIQLLMHIDHSLQAMVLQHGAAVYWLLFALVLGETGMLVLFFLPGNPLIFISGALAGSGQIHFGCLLLVLLSATVLGSHINFFLGRQAAHHLQRKPSTWLQSNRFRDSTQFYTAYGAHAFLVTLYIPILRTFAPFIAGMTQMPLRRFQVFSSLGALLWVGLLSTGGYYVGNLPFVHAHLNSLVVLGVGVGVSMPLLFTLGRLCKRRWQARP